MSVPTKCPEHPKYKVKLKPRCLCETCWRMWIHEQDSNSTLAKILDVQQRLTAAGDRRDWDDCNRLEVELDILRGYRDR